jgi:hypothetical protein
LTIWSYLLKYEKSTCLCQRVNLVSNCEPVNLARLIESVVPHMYKSVDIPWLCEYCMAMWILYGYVNIAWLCEYCMTMWILYDYVNIAWLCEYCMAMWILHGYVNIVWLCEYCMAMWILHGYVNIAWLCDNVFNINPDSFSTNCRNCRLGKRVMTGHESSGLDTTGMGFKPFTPKIPHWTHPCVVWSIPKPSSRGAREC